MKTPVDATLVEQIERFRLRFRCEHCAYFEPCSKSCSEGFPNYEHREAPIELGETVVFCKRFELA